VKRAARRLAAALAIVLATVVAAVALRLAWLPSPRTMRFDVPPQLAADQRRRLETLRAERDGPAVASALAALEGAAAGTENLMPAIITAVSAEATLGEICATLRSRFGAYRPASAAQI